MNKILPLKTTPDPLKLTSCRDDLLVDLVTKVRFNRYDLKFLSNIHNKYISVGKPLSPKQNELFEKLIHKYRKQLKKLQVDYKKIIALPWINGIVSQDKLTQKTFFKLVEKEDDAIEMQLYFNFDKKQIEEIRTLLHDDFGNHLNKGVGDSFGSGCKYNFTWNNIDKIWLGPFNLYLFKELYFWAKKNNVRVDKTASDLVNKLIKLGTKEEWTPQIKIIHNRLYISHYTESMESVLQDFNFNDTSIQNIERLVKLGLKAPEEVNAIAQYVNSVSGNEVHKIYNAKDVNILKQYIKDSARKCVFFSYTAPWKNKEEKEINLDDIGHWDSNVKRFDSMDKDLFDIDKLVKTGYNTLITTEPMNSLFNSQTVLGKFALLADKVIYISLVGKSDNSKNNNRR